MRVEFKKGLSVCLGLALSMSALPLNGLAPYGNAPETAPETKEKTLVTNAADDTASGERQLFAAMTIEDGKQLSVNGKSVGTEYGGVELSETGDIIINADGRKLTLEEAEEELGFVVNVNNEGKKIITAPFQAAKLIVRSEQPFEDPAAVSVEERIKDNYIVTYASQSEAYKAYKRISEDSSIVFVEPDMVVQALEGSSAAFDDFDFSGEDSGDDNTIDGDTKFIDSWGRTLIGADKYCEWLKNEKKDLPEIKVAVIDTGIYANHKLFKNRLLDGGKSFVDGMNGRPIDGNGHGSHCAGIICSSTPENVKILPVQALDERGSGYVFDIYSSIMYAIDQDVDIMSISIGCSGKSHLVEEALEAARRKGITVCVAAGNESADTYTTYGTFSSVESAVVVASINSENEPSYFSNYGRTVDFAAPGEEINSVSLRHDTATIRHSGTSMATPFTAAVFADILSYDETYSRDLLYNIVKSNAVDICDIGFDEKSGWGRVDLTNVKFIGDYIMMPSISVPTGQYSGTQNVRLSCETDDAVIYYTLDGTKPSAKNGVKYDGGFIEINSTSRIRAVSVKDGAVSGEASEYYEIGGIANDAMFIIDDGMITKYSGFSSVVDIAGMAAEGKLSEITAIGENVFRDNTVIERVIIPESVKKIGIGAFMNCTSLKSVVTSAEELGESVFRGCYRMTEFKDGHLKKTGFGAFMGCEKLTDISEKNLEGLNDYVFYKCGKLTNDKIDISSAKYFGKYCLSESGITGSIDVSGGERFDMAAFANTLITGIRFSEKLTTLPECLLEGCINLTELSAPGVTNIKCKALGLGKLIYKPEAVVKTDIDFSKVTNLEVGAFEGYVFDGPVSFDSLDPSTPMNAFIYAFGEYLTLPTLTHVETEWNYPINEDWVFNHYNFDIIELPNAVSIGNELDAVFDRANLILLSDDFGLDTDVETPIGECGHAHYVTRKPNEYLEKLAHRRKIEYSAAPVMEFNLDFEPMYCYINTEYNIIPSFINDGYSAEWGFKCYYERFEAVDYSDEEYDAYSEKVDAIIAASEIKMLDRDGRKPLNFKHEKPGVYTYIYRVTNNETGEYTDREIIVNVYDLQNLEVKENQMLIDDDFRQEFLIMHNVWYYRYISDVTFTPERTDDYTLMYSGFDVTVYNGDEVIGKYDVNPTEPPVVSLEKGVKYRFRLERENPGHTPDYDETEKLYNSFHKFMITSPDTKLIPMESLTDFTVSFDNCEYDPANSGANLDLDQYDVVISTSGSSSKEVKPEIVIKDGDYTLVEGVDYIYILKNILDDYVEYNITGIGRYYGELNAHHAYVLPKIKLGERVSMGKTANYMFTPEKDGYYNFATSLTDEFLEKRMDTSLGDMGGFYIPYVYVQRYDPITGDIELVSMSFNENDTTGNSSLFCEVESVELKAGEQYVITNFGDPKELVITDGTTLNDCTFEYQEEYEFNGEPVVPVMTVRNKNGEVLTEGVDYTFTYWRNDEPGIMYAYIKGINNYPGSRCFFMNIKGGNTSMDEAWGDKAVRIEMNKKFYAIPHFVYVFDVEEDGVYYFDTYDEPSIFISELTEHFTGFYEELTPNREFNLTKGTYAFYFNRTFENFNAELKKRDDMVLFTEENITAVPAEYTGKVIRPDVKIVCGDTELVKNVDYKVTTDDPITEPGIYRIVVENTTTQDTYRGRVVMNFAVSAPETAAVSDGTNSLTVSPEKPVQYSWTPEQSEYSIFSSSNRLMTIGIIDEDGKIIKSSEIARRFPVEAEVVPGKNYTIILTSDAEEEFELSIKCSGLLSKCKAEWEKSMVFSDAMKVPEVKFTDGDYVLEYGKDYIVTDESFIHTYGCQEFIFSGCGDYSGDVVIPVYLYAETLPESDEITQMTPETLTAVGNNVDNPGSTKVLRVTNDSALETSYRISPLNIIREKTDLTFIAAYEEDGKLIGINEDVADFTLKPGETRYFTVAANCYVDDYDHYYASISIVVLNVTGRQAITAPSETTTVSAETTTVSTETTTVSAETTTVSAETTAAPDTTETTSAGTTETTTSSAAPATESTSSGTQPGTTTETTPAATTTVPTESELPETGYSSIYDVIFAVSAAMTFIGAAAVISTRRKEEE